MSTSISVEQLSKIFGNGVRAVDQISFAVEEGEIFGFLGPNGAGKSTTISMLTTLVKPSSGTIHINGINVWQHPTQARRHIGYVSQDLAVDDDLTGRDNIRLQAGLYHIPRRDVAQRSADALQMVGLTARADDLVAHYSGGMRKRLDIACGLIHHPRLLFLDEPTLGLDIQTRQEIWHYITKLRAENRMTIFLTTHYMEEADALCDRIAIIDRGHIVVLDSPAALKGELGGDTITFSFASGTAEEIARAVALIGQLPIVSEIRELAAHREYCAMVAHGETAMPEFFRVLAQEPACIGMIQQSRPTLDDVFLHYTGRQLRDTEGGGAAAMRTRMTMRRLRG